MKPKLMNLMKLLPVILLTASVLSAAPTLQWIPLPPIPDPEGFAGGFAGVSHGALLFAGGSNFVGKRPWEGGTKLYYDSVYLLPGPQSYWREVGKLPVPNGYGVSGTFGDEFIIAGGGTLPGPYRDVFALRWDGHSLHRRTLPSLPRPRAFSGGIVVGHTLYVSCGTESSQFVAVKAFSDLWALDLSDPHAQWMILPSLPGPGRVYPIAGASGEDFYVFGGTALRADEAGKPVITYLQDAYVYRPRSGWARIAELPHPEAGAPSPAVTAPDGSLVILSGDDGTRVTLNGPNHPGFPETGMVYDPRADRWSVTPEIPLTRSTAPFAFWAGMWVTVGGERKPGYRTPDTWGVRLGSE